MKQHVVHHIGGLGQQMDLIQEDMEEQKVMISEITKKLIKKKK